jgi:hypothetical protein
LEIIVPPETADIRVIDEGTVVVRVVVVDVVVNETAFP